MLREKKAYDFDITQNLRVIPVHNFSVTGGNPPLLFTVRDLVGTRQEGPTAEKIVGAEKITGKSQLLR